MCLSICCLMWILMYIAIPAYAYLKIIDKYLRVEASSLAARLLVLGVWARSSATFASEENILIWITNYKCARVSFSTDFYLKAWPEGFDLQNMKRLTHIVEVNICNKIIAKHDMFERLIIICISLCKGLV